MKCKNCDKEKPKIWTLAGGFCSEKCRDEYEQNGKGKKSQGNPFGIEQGRMAKEREELGKAEG